MNYPQVSAETAAAELNRLHGEIENKMRSTVQDAIRAGEILSKIKEQLGHGDFLPWIKLNCRFSQQSASNYMRLFEYRSKLPTVGNLQEAYKQVESLEAQAKMSEEQQARQRVLDYQRTGTRPDGWRRGTDDKLVQEKKEQDAKVKRMQEDMKREHEERTNQQQARDSRTFEYEQIKEMSEALVTSIAKRQEFKDRIRLSSESDQFTEALMDYLEELADDNRRIEACYNIIKVCKGIVHDLQRGKV